MKVDRVTATIKYSQNTGKRAWKAVEIGAEATLDGKERWQQAQANLYAEISQQLKTLWSNGTGEGTHNGSQSHGEPVSEPEPTLTLPVHYCEEHQTEFKHHERQGKVWYSHKAPDGNWCREGA